MDIEISEFQLKALLQSAAEMGAVLALSKIGKLKYYLKKSEAFKLYGRANVENWILEGLITPRKDGDHSGSWRIDRIELEAIHVAIELSRYF